MTVTPFQIVMSIIGMMIACTSLLLGIAQFRRLSFEKSQAERDDRLKREQSQAHKIDGPAPLVDQVKTLRERVAEDRETWEEALKAIPAMATKLVSFEQQLESQRKQSSAAANRTETEVARVGDAIDALRDQVRERLTAVEQQLKFHLKQSEQDLARVDRAIVDLQQQRGHRP